MILNTFEYLMMNNPVRAMLQRRYEARKLLRMGGPMRGGRALEVGCGRGVGVEVILDCFGADAVDAFDLDPRMVAKAGRRLKRRGDRARLWVGDAARIDAADATYDAVFDFGIIHHVPEWRAALAEIFRVLKPGGRFYAEEVLRAYILHPIWRRLLDHPLEDRFDHAQFQAGLTQAGFVVTAARPFAKSFAWYIADKAAAPDAERA
ncbi:MAG TPA: class I SAM-dependent methyltransferase [Candidatus Hydrogenedentes bacterium]|nr:class I SAM-dependent methyltransferase [Candidatus Hydrogenedentota bacterium]HNT86477.1 class I SAM-dependent methyltransferase [Candidatus Hydrogenedentota bacterium]